MNLENQSVSGRVLLVEDNRADVTLIRQSLKEHRVEPELVVVTDGEEAIDLIDRLDGDESVPCPDVVLLDLNLPKRDGHEVLARVRESRRIGQIPVVITSSSSAVKDEKMAGVTRYFPKPTDLDEFMNIGLVVKSLLMEQNRLKMDSSFGE